MTPVGLLEDVVHTLFPDADLPPAKCASMSIPADAEGSAMADPLSHTVRYQHVRRIRPLI